MGTKACDPIRKSQQRQNAAWMSKSVAIWYLVSTNCVQLKPALPFEASINCQPSIFPLSQRMKPWHVKHQQDYDLVLGPLHAKTFVGPSSIAGAFFRAWLREALGALAARLEGCDAVEREACPD